MKANVLEPSEDYVHRFTSVLMGLLQMYMNMFFVAFHFRNTYVTKA